MLGASLLLALREIRRHLLRSILTVLGIVIGVGAVVTMVTVGNGVTASVRAQIASLGANTLIVVPNAGPRQAGSASPPPFANEDVVAMREQVGGIDGAAGQANSSVTATADGIDWKTATANIRHFLKDKSRVARVRLEHAEEDFQSFWRQVGAEGSLSDALGEWRAHHNQGTWRPSLVMALRDAVRRAIRAAAPPR
jgi:ABC-type lipoprotein release transport system permease subunit